MKSSTKDTAEGTLHQVIGKVKEVAGMVVNNPNLEEEGKEENLKGKVQQKIGQIKKVINK